jgi:hypothetical protein
MQNILALLIVASACGYLMRKAWRYFAARKQSVGCGSACGGCAAGSKSLGEAKPLVSIDSLPSRKAN